MKHKLSKLEELMVITMEECGELTQECSKAIRCQEFKKDSLKEELSDVMCMFILLNCVRVKFIMSNVSPCIVKSPTQFSTTCSCGDVRTLKGPG